MSFRSKSRQSLPAGAANAKPAATAYLPEQTTQIDYKAVDVYEPATVDMTGVSFPVQSFTEREAAKKNKQPQPQTQKQKQKQKQTVALSGGASRKKVDLDPMAEAQQKKEFEARRQVRRFEPSASAIKSLGGNPLEGDLFHRTARYMALADVDSEVRYKHMLASKVSAAKSAEEVNKLTAAAMSLSGAPRSSLSEATNSVSLRAAAAREAAAGNAGIAQRISDSEALAQFEHDAEFSKSGGAAVKKLQKEIGIVPSELKRELAQTFSDAAHGMADALMDPNDAAEFKDEIKSLADKLKGGEKVTKKDLNLGEEPESGEEWEDYEGSACDGVNMDDGDADRGKRFLASGARVPLTLNHEGWARAGAEIDGLVKAAAKGEFFRHMRRVSRHPSPNKAPMHPPVTSNIDLAILRNEFTKAVILERMNFELNVALSGGASWGRFRKEIGATKKAVVEAKQFTLDVKDRVLQTLMDPNDAAASKVESDRIMGVTKMSPDEQAAATLMGDGQGLPMTKTDKATMEEQTTGVPALTETLAAEKIGDHGGRIAKLEEDAKQLKASMCTPCDHDDKEVPQLDLDGGMFFKKAVGEMGFGKKLMSSIKKEFEAVTLKLADMSLRPCEVKDLMRAVKRKTRGAALKKKVELLSAGDLPVEEVEKLGKMGVTKTEDGGVVVDLGVAVTVSDEIKFDLMRVADAIEKDKDADVKVEIVEGGAKKSDSRGARAAERSYMSRSSRLQSKSKQKSQGFGIGVSSDAAAGSYIIPAATESHGDGTRGEPNQHDLMRHETTTNNNNNNNNNSTTTTTSGAQFPVSGSKEGSGYGAIFSSGTKEEKNLYYWRKERCTLNFTAMGEFRPFSTQDPKSFGNADDDDFDSEYHTLTMMVFVTPQSDLADASRDTLASLMCTTGESFAVPGISDVDSDQFMGSQVLRTPYGNYTGADDIAIEVMNTAEKTNTQMRSHGTKIKYVIMGYGPAAPAAVYLAADLTRYTDDPIVCFSVAAPPCGNRDFSELVVQLMKSSKLVVYDCFNEIAISQFVPSDGHRTSYEALDADAWTANSEKIAELSKSDLETHLSNIRFGGTMVRIGYPVRYDLVKPELAWNKRINSATLGSFDARSAADHWPMFLSTGGGTSSVAGINIRHYVDQPDGRDAIFERISRIYRGIVNDSTQNKTGKFTDLKK
jgi:hypothetical protein